MMRRRWYRRNPGGFNLDELQAEVDRDPRRGYRWRIFVCYCGSPFVKKSANHLHCPSCLQKKKSEWKSASSERAGVGKKTQQIRSKCSNCGLAYRPQPGDPSECYVCQYNRAKAEGKPIGDLQRKSWRLAETRFHASLEKPPGGVCVVCGEESVSWYCCDTHMRMGYKILAERQGRKMKRNRRRWW